MKSWGIPLAVAAALLVAVWIGVTVVMDGAAPTHADAVRLKLQLNGDRSRVELHRDQDGAHTFVVRHFDGRSEILTPEEFARSLYDEERRATWVARLFNISSPAGIAWVGLGLLGQLLFTGRMLVQWLASEKRKSSVVPPVFWWLSIIGAAMLLAYFGWRRDIVGLLGQGFGFAVYARNLWLIYGGAQVSITADVDPAPELAAPTMTGVVSRR